MAITLGDFLLATGHVTFEDFIDISVIRYDEDGDFHEDRIRSDTYDLLRYYNHYVSSIDIEENKLHVWISKEVPCLA
jgi:hypothetical protein